MTLTKPHLIVSDESPEQRRARLLEPWNRSTQEQRAKLTVPQLIELMGPLHVNHPDYRGRPHGLLPMPNLTEVNGHVIERHDYRMRAQIMLAIDWLCGWLAR